MWMEVAVAAIIAIVTAAAVATAVLFCVYRLITLLGDPVNTKIEAEINEDKAELKDMGAKLDERWAKLEEREKAERPWGQDDPLN
jgi:Skp family chaperone for outer membrane proteins